MKKLFVLSIIILMTATSCIRSYEEEFKERQIVYSPYEKQVIENIEYYKDSKTNLCFAIFTDGLAGNGAVVALTCVPCDSLKNVEVKIIK